MQITFQRFIPQNTTNKIVCSFKNQADLEIKHGLETVIFKPLLNNTFNNILLNNIIKSHSISLKMIKNECNEKFRGNGGYYFHFGLIYINKNKYNKNKLN